MSNSKDSNLFGNDDELYSSKRHYDEYEPFAQPLPVSGEPLFPTAPVATSATSATLTSAHTWVDPMSEAMAEVGSEPLPDLQGYAHDSEQHSEQHSEQQSHHNPTYASHSYGDQSYTSTELPGVNEDELYARLPVPTITGPVTELSAAHAFAPQTRGERGLATHKPALNEREAHFNRHFAVLMDLMQHGAWPQAVEKLQAMRSEYPDVEALEALLDEAMLKSELMAQWTHKIKGRRLTVGQEWLIRRSLPFLLLLALFVSGAIFYRTFVAPSRQVVAMAPPNQALVEEATGLLQVGQIDQAINLYNLVLNRAPNFSVAQQGLIEASRLSRIAVNYDIAIHVANSGNLERSLRMLQSIKTKSPTFRDIDARLARVNSLLEAEQSYELAERAFAQHRWTDAITHYEQTRMIAADYQAARVDLQLSAAYFLASQRLMTQWPAAQFGTQQIRDFVRKTQEVNGQNETTNLFLTNLDNFIKGERSLQNNNVGQAVEVWRELYDVQPTFLGGYLAEQLYRAYLVLATEVRTDDPTYARELYTLAAAMPVHDSSEARNQLQSLGATVPAAQPTVAFVAAAMAASDNLHQRGYAVALT